jgi:hypothetical protein
VPVELDSPMLVLEPLEVNHQHRWVCAYGTATGCACVHVAVLAEVRVFYDFLIKESILLWFI